MDRSNDSADRPTGSAGSRIPECGEKHGGLASRLGSALGTLVAFFSKPWPKAVLRIAVTVAFVYFVNRAVSGSDCARLLGEVRLLPLAAAVLLGAGAIALQMLRWRIILRANGLPHSLRVSLRTILHGCLLAFITPGRIGELFRALNLDPRRRVTTIVAVIEERSFAVIATVAVGIVCMLLQRLLYQAPFFIPVAAASVVFGTAITLGIIAMFNSNALPRRWGFGEGDDRPAARYLAHLRSLPHARLWGISLAGHLLLLVQTAILFRMFGTTGFLREMFAAGEAFSFMLLLPFFIANIGLREYAFALFVGRLSPPAVLPSQLQGVALGVGTTILIINIIIPAVIGLVWYFLEKQLHAGADSRRGPPPPPGRNGTDGAS